LDLQAKIARAKSQLLTFCDFPGEVEATNNGSERKLRPCVIQRKVTNGYRAMWAAQAYPSGGGRLPLMADFVKDRSYDCSYERA
jgi:hypothetical protein